MFVFMWWKKKKGKQTKEEERKGTRQKKAENTVPVLVCAFRQSPEQGVTLGRFLQMTEPCFLCIAPLLQGCAICLWHNHCWAPSASAPPVLDKCNRGAKCLQHILGCGYTWCVHKKNNIIKQPKENWLPLKLPCVGYDSSALSTLKEWPAPHRLFADVIDPTAVLPSSIWLAN